MFNICYNKYISKKQREHEYLSYIYESQSQTTDIQVTMLLNSDITTSDIRLSPSLELQAAPVSRSYQKFVVSCIHVEANRNYIYAKTACPKSNHFPRYKPKSAQNGRKRDFLGYISKCSNQGFMVF